MGLLGHDARNPGGQSTIQLKRSAVETLLQRLLRQRKGRAKVTRYPAATCPAIPREDGRTGNRSLNYLIKTVADGRLRYWGEPDAPRQWHFHEEDFEGLFRRPKVLVDMAARIAGISTTALERAAAIGMIGSGTDAHGRRQFERSDASDFAEKYCSSKEVRQATGMKLSELQARLDEEGVETIRLLRTVVIRREDLVTRGILPAKDPDRRPSR